jgi:UDP-N-acetylmuramoyl-L-alanyl-D-glutamate--2,6-diaminopimelate ligase
MRQLKRKILVPYHYFWAVGAAFWYRFPARKLTVIGVTGTKGKSSVSEMLYTIFTEAGYVTALSSTIHFTIGKESKPNVFKMTLPGRGFIQKFLAQAVAQGATHAVVEITSEATLQYRHMGLELDALVFTNLQKEHLESHGSMEKYFQAKFRIGKALAHSRKRPRIIVANGDDSYGKRFLSLPVEKRVSFSRTDAHNAHITDAAVSFSYGGSQFSIPQPGEFSLMNALAAIKTAESMGIASEVSKRGLANVLQIKGRAERIDEGQPFLAVVDYAHTSDSLRAIYGAFHSKRKICVLGNTGGGRDTWKRPEMGKIAEEMCAEVILTNEDPYDENPQNIVDDMASGMTKKPIILMDRREAIRYALSRAHEGDAVLITGKGTDPFIMGPKGSKQPWSDARVVREELQHLLTKS